MSNHFDMFIEPVPNMSKDKITIFTHPDNLEQIEKIMMFAMQREKENNEDE